MKIVVISLRAATTRRANVRRQLDAIGLPFEFFDAVEGDGSLAHIHHFDGREFLLNTGRVATAKEIARYASHVAAWRQCADDNEAILLLEDDVRLGLAFPDGVRAVAKAVNRYGFVRVSMPPASSSYSVERLRSFDLRYCRRVPPGALGYAISPAAADRLANAAAIVAALAKRSAAIVEEPIDSFVRRFWRHRQPIYALHPAIVYQHPIGDTTHTRDGGRTPYTPARWLGRAGRKISDAVLRYRYNLALYAAMSFPVLVAKFEFLQFAGRRAG